MIHTLLPQDAGIYECTADNQYSVDRRSFKTDFSIAFDQNFEAFYTYFPFCIKNNDGNSKLDARKPDGQVDLANSQWKSKVNIDANKL